MPGRILIVTAELAQAFTLRAPLNAAFLETRVLCEPPQSRVLVPSGFRPDIILVADPNPVALQARLARYKKLAAQRKIALIAVTDHRPTVGLDFSQSGACDVFVLPTAPGLLLERIRAHLRLKAEQDALRTHLGTVGEIGFQETDEHSLWRRDAQDTVFIVAQRNPALTQLKDALKVQLNSDVQRVSPQNAANVPETASLVILVTDTPLNEASFGVLAKLHKRLERNQIPVLSISDGLTAATYRQAVELGAADCLGDVTDTSHIGMRARALLHAHNSVRHLRNMVTSRIKESVTDPLTGLHNRRYAQRFLERLLHKGRIDNQKVTIILADIDGFKRVNDQFGHIAGDEILKRVSNILEHNLRTNDLIARIGGDEFLIALPDATADVALQLAERLSRTIKTDQSLQDMFEGKNGITLSMGLASSESGLRSIEGLWRTADSALYAAKAAGRGQVMLDKREVWVQRPAHVEEQKQSSSKPA